MGFINIDLSKAIDLVKSNSSKECIICHGWHFKHGSKFQNPICNDFHGLTELCLNISDNDIITVKGVDYHCIIYDISKSEGIQ